MGQCVSVATTEQGAVALRAAKDATVSEMVIPAQKMTFTGPALIAPG